MKGRITYIAYFSVFGALAACALAGYFGWTVVREESERGTRIASAQETSLRQASAARTHALVANTVPEREALDGLFQADVIAMAGTIVSAGKSAGVEVKLGNAVPESAEPGGGGVSISAVGFVVQADGSFPALMRVLRLFEALPIPASVERFDIGRTAQAGEGDTSTSWHMSVHLRVFTTTPLSS